MQSKYKLLVNNTFIFALGIFGSRLITFLLVPLYTNVLTTGQYGTADLIVTCANLVVPLISVVIQDSVIRFGLTKHIDAGSVIKNAYIVLALGTLVAVIMTPLYDYYPALMEWKYYLLCISVTNMFSNVMFAYAKALEKNKLYSFASVLSAAVLTLSNIIFLVVLKLDIHGFLLGNIIAHIVPVLFLVVFTGTIKSILFARFDKYLLFDMLKYSTPLIVNNLSWWFLTSSNRLMIEYYCTAASLGLYAAGSKIPNLVYLITGIFSQAWTVSAIKEYDDEKDNKFYANVFKIYSFVLFFSCSLIIFSAKPFMSIYVGSAFFESWKFVPILVVGATYHGFSSFYGAVYCALKKNVNVAITTLVSALINLLINYLFLKQFGVFTAVLSTAISYFILGILQMVDSQRFFVFEIDYKKFLINTVIIWMQALLISFEFSSYYFISILCLLTIIIINYNEFKNAKLLLLKLFKKL